ncbi:hypothetical protein PFMG_04227 [Plasmodium falciparum IGH-CR14]|uniref:Uncharacterized protein n=1 Tax=Plasmodium falciparum IGH-CR14 TaxID=580059 RepID=A0A0L1IG11_PLAFA|nr:hypothetical protein PFMG_04227 [Plasmodium falciparum IGH-CR14]
MHFIYYNNLYKKVDVNDREYKINDDLKNIILLFGRIAEPYYPKAVEQFNHFKEPYSKYIYTNNRSNYNNNNNNNYYNININSSSNDPSAKWKFIFRDIKKMDKNMFHERICQLKFKWPINKDENITEYDFYNYIIERCLYNINIMRSNIQKLKYLLTKIVGNNKNKENVFLSSLSKEVEKEYMTHHVDTKKNNNHNEHHINDNNNNNNIVIIPKDKINNEPNDNKNDNNDNNDSNNNDNNNNQHDSNFITSTSQLNSNNKIKILEKLENFNLNSIFKQHNRSYSRLLVNEVFNKEYPSKKITDIFLNLIFQKNVDEFTYESFIKHLNILGRKIELINCDFNSNIYFDQFHFLMKSELKKNSLSVKKKTKKKYSSKAFKNKKENNTKNVYENKTHKKKKNSILINQPIITNNFQSIKEQQYKKLEQNDHQSNIKIHKNIHDQNNINSNNILQTNININEICVFLILQTSFLYILPFFHFHLL